MRIAATTKFPPHQVEATQLTLEDACNLVDAQAAQLQAENQYITRLETVLEHCEEYFCDASALREIQLLCQIKDVLGGDR